MKPYAKYLLPAFCFFVISGCTFTPDKHQSAVYYYSSQLTKAQFQHEDSALPLLPDNELPLRSEKSAISLSLRPPVSNNRELARGQLSEEKAEEVPALDKEKESFARAHPTGMCSPSGEKIYAGKLVSLDLIDASVNKVVEGIFEKITGLDIIVDHKVRGKVDLRLIDIPWDQALNLILNNNCLEYTLEGNTMYIRYRDGYGGWFSPDCAWQGQQTCSSANSISTVEKPKTDIEERLVAYQMDGWRISEALRIIAETSQLNIVVRDDVNLESTLTQTLGHIPWDQALEYILENYCLTSYREGRIIFIYPQTNLWSCRLGKLWN